jgi:hypothetical protein
VVVVVQDVEPVDLQRLLHGEALEVALDVLLRDGARVVAVLAGVQGALGRELLIFYCRSRDRLKVVINCQDCN